MKISGLDSE